MRTRITGAALRALVLFGSLIPLSLLAGCEATVPGPRSGRPVSVEQAQLEYKQIEAEKKAEAQAEDAAFRRQVDRFQRQAKRDIAALNIECAEKAQQLQDNLDEAISQLEATHNASVSARETMLATTFQTLTIQIKEAQAKAETWANIAGIAETVSPAFGPAGLAVGSVIGLAGTLFGWKKKGDASVATTQAQQEAAKRAETLATFEKVVDAIDVAKTSNPKMAEAFKESGNLLNEWMGSKAKALVSQLQEHGAKEAA